MKVFFVMVLVLVAGAVPSHGRTESEGTAFNKTQPHESMNNVTISSSKFGGYDRLLLVMQWPTSYCNFLTIGNRQCNQRVFGRFTVHGLWPQSPSGGIDCTNWLRYRRSQRFDSSQLNRRYVPILNTIWPDLESFANDNKCFWALEYNKHGSCTFGNENDYFWRTINLLGRLRLEYNKHRLSGPIISPGNHRPWDIGNAVHIATGRWPFLVCVKVGDSIQLLEIRFCVWGLTYEPYNCYGVSNSCGIGNIWVP